MKKAHEEGGWRCYMVECGDSTIYTGITTDPERRLAEHNRGTGARYTRSRLPVRLIYEETHPNRSAASKREAALKKLSHARKLALADGWLKRNG